MHTYNAILLAVINFPCRAVSASSLSPKLNVVIESEPSIFFILRRTTRNYLMPQVYRLVFDFLLNLTICLSFSSQLHSYYFSKF